MARGEGGRCRSLVRLVSNLPSFPSAPDQAQRPCFGGTRARLNPIATRTAPATINQCGYPIWEFRVLLAHSQLAASRAFEYSAVHSARRLQHEARDHNWRFQIVCPQADLFPADLLNVITTAAGRQARLSKWCNPNG
jgi:hypothetical protein